MEKTLTQDLKVVSGPRKKLDMSAYALLTSHGFNYIVSIFVSTFLISYIYSISTNYVLNIGLFYCFNYFSMAIFCYFVSKLIDKTNRVVCYRIAIVVRALFILLVVFLGKDLAKVVILAGILHGFSEAWYWSSFNIMKNEIVPNLCMKQYSTYQIIENKTVHFVVPIVLGKIIDAESFKVSAIIILCVAVIQTIVSLFIKAKKPENSHFDLKGFFAHTHKNDKNKEIFKICFISALLFGATSLVSPVNTIIIMLTFKSNFSLGLLTGVFSMVSILMLIIIRKLVKTGKTGIIYWFCAILSVLSTIVVVVLTHKVTIIIFNFVYIAVSTLYSYYFDLYRNVIIKKLHLFDDIAEYQCMIEMVLELSRVVGFGLMILTGAIGGYFGESGLILALKIFFIISILIYGLTGLVFKRFEKVLIRNEVLQV